MTTDTITPIEADTMAIDELTQRLGIGLTQGYEMARTNTLPIPTIKVGRQYRFSRRAYDALMNGQHSTDATDAA